MNIADYDDTHVWITITTEDRPQEEIDAEHDARWAAAFDGKDPWDDVPLMMALHDQLAGDTRENMGMPRGMGPVPNRDRRYKFETLAQRCGLPIGGEGWRDAVITAVQSREEL